MTDLEQKLRKISDQERHILQCLSIFWEQITAQEFHQLLKFLGLKTPEGKGYSAQYVSLLRTSWINKVWSRIQRSIGVGGFQLVNDELKEFFTREARLENWFDETVQIIQASFPLSQYSGWYNRDRFNSRLLRDFRLSIYQKKTEKNAELFKLIVERELTEKSSKIIPNIFSNPFQADVFGRV
ncbi:MAG: hypothetical protein HC846_01285 [Blastocatellia bacterium]|nr:hypothetical protein [Blastocatellia bacterium]